MIWCCSSCRYVFERENEPMYCPDCGKEYIRYASKSEREEYFRYQREFYPEKLQKIAAVG
ncbi:MAG: hypothetical protein IJV14_18830 [Lachnospiraceae bacterium]|nr:hypothetical protein [Lachnospiraceae bacterium]